MVGAMAAIGDVVSPRERGRYQGLFGAVFGLASVIGPLLGGFFTSSLSLALDLLRQRPGRGARVRGAGGDAADASRTSVQRTDRLPRRRRCWRWRWSGSCSLCTLGGNNYAWISPFIIALRVVSVLLIVAFFYVEGRAAEPVLPPHLFRNRVFNVTSAIGFVVGFALFGSVTYLPLFLQVVGGASPTGSGLQILPLMARAADHLDRVRADDHAHRQVQALPDRRDVRDGRSGCSCCRAWTPRPASSVSSLYMFVLGLGLGMVMQVLVLAVQNAVDYSDLGVATSGATLFRSIGGSVGTAILGSIFASRPELESDRRI